MKYKKRVYAFYDNIRFEDFSQSQQLQFAGVANDNPETPITIKATNSKVSGYKEYKVTFDEKKNKSGYFLTPDYEHQHFDHYFVKNSFKAYANEIVVLFDCSYKITDAMLAIINGLISSGKNNQKRNPNVILQKRDIDLYKVAIKTKMIGAWFSFENIANMKTTGTFGPDVNESELYQDLKKQGGKLKAINVLVTYKNSEYTVIISQNGSIAIQNNTTFEESLEIVEYVLSNLIRSS